MNLRNLITTGIELVGAALVVFGIATFSVPVSVIVAGVILILVGGLAA